MLRFLTPLPIVLIIVLFTASFMMPEWVNTIAGVTLVIGLLIGMYAVVQKHIRQRQSQPVSKLTTARNIFVDITGILLAMIVAGLLGRVVSEAATRQINNELTKLMAGIVIGMLMGLCVGVFVRRVWRRVTGSF